MYGHFEHNGPNGRHVCMLFEMLGENLLKVIERYDYKGIPISIVKNIVRQVCMGLDFLHRHCSIIHTDLKPENILIAKAPTAPSSEYIQNLMNNTISQKSIKKSKKGNSNTIEKTIEAVQKQLSNEKTLSTEQRRKLKKKLKKKKQQVKKNEKKKRKSGARRANNNDRSESPISADAAAKEEMMMMERDSIPLGLDEDKAADPKEFGNLTVNDSKLDREEDIEDKLSTVSQTDLSLDNVEYNKTQEWLRPTLFSYLNFSITNDNTKSQQPEYTKAFRVTGESWEAPPDDMYAKISMIVPIQKLCELFGPPEIFDEDVNIDEVDPHYIDWYLSLLSLDDSKIIDEKLQFAIRGFGADVLEIMTTASTCVLNGLLLQPSKYSLSEDNKQPMLWNIIHHASMTEHLIAFLESKIHGLSFLVHYDINNAITSDDDMEMLYIARKSCIHPISFVGEYSSTEEDRKVKYGSPQSLTQEISHFDIMQAGGCLIGLDLDYLISNIVEYEEEPMWDEIRPPKNLSSHVLPLDVRMKYFVGDELLEIANTVVGLSVNQDYDGYGSAGEDEDYDRISRSKLDLEYQHTEVKIVDLGNACWRNKHFTDDIQTRQYRSPEVLLGAHYDTSADMWSLACIVFELLTGDLLFDPQNGQTWDREEDHLAMIIELLGNFPKSIISSGSRSSQYFNKRGELKHIHQLKFWGLYDVLCDKYKLPMNDAREVADFLLPILEIDPDKRATAFDCLQHSFLKTENDYEDLRK